MEKIVRLERIGILGGYDKNGQPEPVREVEFNMGQVASIVGATGSGKTTLIKDVELLANKNTPSNRTITFNGIVPSEEYCPVPSDRLIALITQHTNFLSDMRVKDFLVTHASIRGSRGENSVVDETLMFANQLTGESIDTANVMTELSGGQTRALMIADAVVIGESPIILLDEIENAGIHRIKVLELLKQYKKIFIFVTHDPRITLLSDFRIVMKNGAMQKVIATNGEEKKVVEQVKKIDDLLLRLRAYIRNGEIITEFHLKE
ncbi:MAG: ATP-binding cassette domain-containing protein [Candidatus Omnitrophica bacterium]|jgi:ABC-type lipoprotein export system ATPase subunit|nr:ATP-binding cassette domain-containing protein [Candidatus Omnitrophota bacterium]MDD5518177.1 ATP-binding cassette domain-containing protein [Candidatus Omnitrophota bacterium]